MNQLRNRVQLFGRLGKDPEVKNLPDGKMVVRFSLATTENYKNGEGEKVSDTQWHQIVAWGGLAGIIASWVSKGQEVMVEGKLCYRHYENKEGRKIHLTQIIAREILMLSPSGQQRTAGSGAIPAGV